MERKRSFKQNKIRRVRILIWEMLGVETISPREIMLSFYVSIKSMLIKIYKLLMKLEKTHMLILIKLLRKMTQLELLSER